MQTIDEILDDLSINYHLEEFVAAIKDLALSIRELLETFNSKEV